jgi:hypothetical protein
MTTTSGIKPGHLFTSYSGPNYHSAKCECGRFFVWDDREEEHARHVLAVVWQEGAEAVALATIPGAAPLTNPYVS